MEAWRLQSSCVTRSNVARSRAMRASREPAWNGSGSQTGAPWSSSGCSPARDFTLDLTGGGPGARVPPVARRRPRPPPGRRRARGRRRLAGGGDHGRGDAGPGRRRPDVGAPPVATAGLLGDGAAGRAAPPRSSATRRPGWRRSTWCSASSRPRRIRAVADEGNELMGLACRGWEIFADTRPPGRGRPGARAARRRESPRRGARTRAGHPGPRRPRHGEHGLRGRRPGAPRLGDAERRARGARRRPVPRGLRLGRGPEPRGAAGGVPAGGRPGGGRDARCGWPCSRGWSGWAGTRRWTPWSTPTRRSGQRERADLDWWVRAARTTLESGGL